MINNMNLILPYFYFNEANNMFMHCQIMQRSKDHPGEKVRKSPIKTYFVQSREHLERIMPEIIMLCEHYGARAYINLSAKDFAELQKLMLFKLSNEIYQGTVRNPRLCLHSAAGELKSRGPKWVIDVDDISIKEDIIKELEEEFRLPKYPNTQYLYGEIPTVNGCHLIVRPFDIRQFSSRFPDVDVHKNSGGTLLYYPDSLSTK